MIAVEGIYDGPDVFPDEAEEIRQFAAQADGFKFWETSEEDIYQDYLV